MLTVTTEPGIGSTIIEATLDGETVAQAVVVHEPTVLTGSDIRHRVHRFWLAPRLRKNDEFAAELYPALIAKAIEMGWATEADMGSYEWTDEGIKIGPVLINLTSSGERDAALEFRIQARNVAEAHGAAADLSPELEALVELTDAGLTKDEIVALAGGPTPPSQRDPDLPPTPTRPLET